MKITDKLIEKAYTHATSEKIVKTKIGWDNPTFKDATRRNKNLKARLRAFAQFILDNQK